MHVYIYDSYLSQNKYDSVTAKIETRITDLGLSGKIVRLGCMNSVYNTIEDELKKNVKTIVVVGNINILNQAINAFASFSKDRQGVCKTPLGFIPVGKKDNKIAEALGIKDEEEACNILSARRIELVDLGLANDEYFLTEAKITTNKTSVEINEDYTIEINEKGEIYVINMLNNLQTPSDIKPKVNDGVLELFIKLQNKPFSSLKNSKKENSIISFDTLTLLNPEQKVVLDETIQIASPVKVKIAKEKINLIVGKNRLFD